MDLEIIERGEPSPHLPTLLFVHGYWQAAWTWDEHVVPGLAEKGHHCLAVSLRGHGESEGKIRGASIADYVEDVAKVVSMQSVPPVIVGHSMGGFTTQHYLAGGHPAAAVILVAPVPRKGAWGATFKAMRKHPWAFAKTNLTLDVGAIVETPERAYDFLGSPSFPRQDLDRYTDRLERASYRTYLDLLLNRPDFSEVSTPALVVGGTEDAFFTVEEWQDTADALQAEMVVLEGLGHQPMWEDSGERLIEEIDRFVRTLS